ncbi:MAG: DEAD/DEAH box helicase, partial [Dactylosporangium sp.]|nr:DEAD/DEAH box helicase [Dactylosporangium sp.]
DRMLFLTATPFQLSHDELIRVLRRFHGVRWRSQSARDRFDEQLDELSSALNRSRAAALRLERAWSRLDASDESQIAAATTFEVHDGQSERVRTAIAAAAAAHDELRAAEKLLRPWVIRHTRASRMQRRTYYAGRAILDEQHTGMGLPVDGEAVLPFLLAARAEAIAALHSAGKSSPVRGYYAYGLASSFEAYADTRANRLDTLDDLETPDHAATPGPATATAHNQLRWYVKRIEAALPRDTADGWVAHPKVAATVRRVVDLWRRGEKILVFCFYRETGRALRNHISRAIRGEIIARAARALDRPADDDVLGEVEAIADRLLRSDASGYDAFRERVASYLDGIDDATAQRVQDVAVRFMRTPSFLTRYVDLSPDLTIEGLLAGLDRGESGTTFADHIRAFAAALAQQVDAERDAVLDALTSIQTGGIRVTSEHFDASERSRDREVLLPNVRLVNGQTRQEVRQTLMQTFNTPFFPEVLIASSVMAEGVDLHHACRHVIHHDLDWNPSTLEQRTGRVDRIGSLAARVGQPVVVYEPYVGGTHDEKMFRVVKDRERWFGIVMGESPDISESATERQAARIPLP